MKKIQLSAVEARQAILDNQDNIHVLDNLHVYENLRFRHSKIKTLPGNLSVRGLDLSYSQIEELPDNLSVKGYLYLTHTQIKTLPDNLSVGYLDLSYSQIEELPDNLSVKGSLDLSYSQIEELPDNLSVNGSLDLTHTQIKTLPGKIYVGGNIHFPKDFDYLHVSGCGHSARTIYLCPSSKEMIQIGCFKGTQGEAIERIKEKYKGQDAAQYIEKVNECFEINRKQRSR